MECEQCRQQQRCQVSLLQKDQERQSEQQLKQCQQEGAEISQSNYSRTNQILGRPIKIRLERHNPLI